MKVIFHYSNNNNKTINIYVRRIRINYSIKNYIMIFITILFFLTLYMYINYMKVINIYFRFD